MTPNEYIRKLQEDNKMSCKLTYEELHKRYHDAADENKELRQILAKMSTLVTSEVPSGIFQNYLQEENDRLALSVETFRRHQEKDSDKKKNLHDYLVTVLGYNQEQIMEIMESGAMLSNDPGVGYKFEHDFGKEHALDVGVNDELHHNENVGRRAFTDGELPISEVTEENVLFGGSRYTVIQRGDFCFYLNDELFTTPDLDGMIDELDPDTTAQLFDKADYVFEIQYNEGEEIEGLEKYILVKNPSMTYPTAFVPDNSEYPENTQVEMDFDNPDEGMVDEETDDGISTERHPRHVYAHMGYSR